MSQLICNNQYSDDTCEIDDFSINTFSDNNSETIDIDSIIDDIECIFDIPHSSINPIDGHFLVENDSDQKRDLSSLSEVAATQSIQLSAWPVIDGQIQRSTSPVEQLKTILTEAQVDFSFDKRYRLQVPLSIIENLEPMLQSMGPHIEATIPDEATIILPISPNPVLFLSKKFPNIEFNYKIKGKREKDNTIPKSQWPILWKNKIIVIGGYFKQSVLDELAPDLDLSLVQYIFKFFVSLEAISKYDPKKHGCYLPKIDPTDNSFSFKVKLGNPNRRDPESDDYDERMDFNFHYTLLKKSMDSIFGADNVHFQPQFLYTYNNRSFEMDFLPKQDFSHEELIPLLYSFLGNSGVSINRQGQSIGIDFNWKDDDIVDVIRSKVSLCPCINFTYYPNHRCTVNYQIHDLAFDQIEQSLRAQFPDINIKRDDKGGTIYFHHEYQTQQQRVALQKMLDVHLSILNPNIFASQLSPIPTTHDKYILHPKQ